MDKARKINFMDLSIKLPCCNKDTCNTFKGSEINKNFTIDKSRQIVTMATKGNIQ